MWNLLKSTSCYEYICFSQDNEHKQLLPIHKYLILPICNGTPKTFLFSWPGLHLQRNCIYCVVYSYSLWHLLLLGFLLGNQHFSHNSLYLENAILVQKHVVVFFFFFFCQGKAVELQAHYYTKTGFEICAGWKWRCMAFLSIMFPRIPL